VRTILSVLQHHRTEGAGQIAVWARRAGVELAVYRADLEDLPEPGLAPCVLLGGPWNVNEPPAWMCREQNWLALHLACGAPVLGICLGSQLLAQALGGSVTRMPSPETGWTTVDFTDGRRREFLQWHEDAFTLPPGAELIASTASCAQMFRTSGGHAGIQFHPEWDAPLVDDLNAAFGAASPLPRVADELRHREATLWLHDALGSWFDAEDDRACGGGNVKKAFHST
jgi:GMP synthase-like glutamine amidotransferase